MYGKMSEPGLLEIIPLICISATWGHYPVCVLISRLLRVLHPGGVTWWLQHLLFTDMAGNILVHMRQPSSSNDTERKKIE